MKRRRERGDRERRDSGCVVDTKKECANERWHEKDGGGRWFKDGSGPAQEPGKTETCRRQSILT